MGARRAAHEAEPKVEAPLVVAARAGAREAAAALAESVAVHVAVTWAARAFGVEAEAEVEAPEAAAS